MTYDARQIANWFVDRAKRDGRQLSVMSLLKLVYIAHGWHLETQGEPLFTNGIQAWQYGPVIPDVYRDFRKQGVTITEKVGTVDDASLARDDENLLEQIWQIYGGLSAFRLSDITHVTGGPWEQATRIGGYYANITNDLILSHYKDLRARAQGSASQ